MSLPENLLRRAVYAVAWTAVKIQNFPVRAAIWRLRLSILRQQLLRIYLQTKVRIYERRLELQKARCRHAWRKFEWASAGVDGRPPLSRTELNAREIEFCGSCFKVRARYGVVKVRNNHHAEPGSFVEWLDWQFLQSNNRWPYYPDND